MSTKVNIFHRHLSDELDHSLSLAFYNDVQTMIQQRVPYAIKATGNIVVRAIYLHGFLYEQSERLLHLNIHQNNNIPQIKLTGAQLQRHLMREILMMRNLIVMTNAIFSIPGNEKKKQLFLFYIYVMTFTVVSKLKVEFNYSTIASTIQLFAFHYHCFPKHFTKGFSSVGSSNLMLILIDY